MRHADDHDLDAIEDLLGQLRGLEGLRERRRGTFYCGGRSMLHFHADETGVHADVRTDPEVGYVRVPVRTATEQARLLADVRNALCATPTAGPRRTRGGRAPSGGEAAS